MYFTLADGNKMFYDQAGAGATAFVCIHGGGGDHRHVQPQFEFLSKKSCAINVDLRGYGASDSLTKYGTISEYAEDIAQLLGHLDIKRAIIVGHSLGGMVAVEFAARFAKLTTAIIMISSGIVFLKTHLMMKMIFYKGLPALILILYCWSWFNSCCHMAIKINLLSKRFVL